MANYNFVDGVYNFGTDLTVTVIDNDTGAPISLAGRLVSYKDDPTTAFDKSLPIDNQGVPAHRTSPQGHTITMSIERFQGDLESLQALMESNFFSTGAQKYFTVSKIVRNRNNKQVDTFKFLRCVGALETSGEYKHSEKVMVNLKFEASQKVPG